MWNILIPGFISQSCNLLPGPPKGTFLSTEWVDYVKEPMKYQALRPHFFSMGGWWCAGEGCCGWWMKGG